MPPDSYKGGHSDDESSPDSATSLFGPLPGPALDIVPPDRSMPPVQEIRIRPPELVPRQQGAGTLPDLSFERTAPSQKSAAPELSEFTRIMQSFREHPYDPPNSSAEDGLDRKVPTVGAGSPQREAQTFTELFNSFSEPAKESPAADELSRGASPWLEPSHPSSSSTATFGPGSGSFTSFLESLNQKPNVKLGTGQVEESISPSSQTDGAQNGPHEIPTHPEVFSSRINQETEHNVRILKLPPVAEGRADRPAEDDATKLFAAPPSSRHGKLDSAALPRNLVSTPLPGDGPGGLLTRKVALADTATNHVQEEAARKLDLQGSGQVALISGKFQRYLTAILILNTCLLIALLCLVAFIFLRR